MISREHMALCPFCASHMRANGHGVEIVTMFGLLALAHSHCIAREARPAPKAPPPPLVAAVQQQPERVGS
jgi:hypothetical protein